MAHNIPPDVLQRRLIYLRIPNECWTDVFKTFARRILTQQIAPVSFRFKEICDKNVKSIHVIEKAIQFTGKLNEDDPEANRQLEQLAGNDCNLAGQFRLAKMWICNEKGQAILRHCPDLFIGCAIGLDFNEENKSSPLFLECLAELEKAKPVMIYVSRVDQVIDCWHHPTFLNCNRIHLYFYGSLSLSAATAMNIFDWLHHQPNGVDCDGSATDTDDEQEVRCMILWDIGTDQDHIDWLISRCSEDIQQSRNVPVINGGSREYRFQ